MRYEGWHRALDVQLDTHKWCVSPAGLKLNTGVFWSLLTEKGQHEHPDNEAEAENLARHLAMTLWQGDTIFITNEMENLIVQAAEDLPDDYTIDLHTCMSKHGFVLLDSPVRGEDRNGKSVAVHAFAWEVTPLWDKSVPDSPLEEAVMIYFFVDPYDVGDDYNVETNRLYKEAGIPIPPLSVFHMYPAREGQGIPQFTERGSQLIGDMLKLFIAMQLLSHQSIGEPVRMRPDRASRKRYEREYPGKPERMITLITLRRKNVKHNDEPAKIEWSRRWVVRGHWRKQYYPSTKTHDWKYIYEYIKGPEDKPLVTGRRVFNFRR